MKKIFIASVLKPVTDPRMYDKIGLSLAEEGYKVYIAGYNTPVPFAKKVNFYPLFKFRRISFQRLLAPVKILRLLFKLKPDLFIATTYELLVPAVVYNFFSKKPVIYDVQENYFKNLIYMKTLPIGINYILGLCIRFLEKVTSPFFSGFILAEKVYSKELSFVKSKFIVAENKFKEKGEIIKKETPFILNKDSLTLLYSGTVAEEFGIWRAIDLVEKLHLIYPFVRLKIIGFAPVESLRVQIIRYVKGKRYIITNIQNTPVPYKMVLQALSDTDFLLLPYKLNKAIKNKVPTKLYEGLALRIPMIIQENPVWEELCEEYKAAEFIDFSNYQPESILKSLKNEKFYTSKSGSEVLWESEEANLLKFIKDIMK